MTKMTETMNVAHATLQNNWIYLIIFFSVLSQIKVKADFVWFFFLVGEGAGLIYFFCSPPPNFKKMIVLSL